MSRPVAALLILTCSFTGTALAQPPVRKFDDPGAPPFKVLKTDGSIDIVAEYRLAGCKVAVDDAFDSFPQERLTEILIALRPLADGLLEIMSKGHYRVSCCFFLRL